MVELLDEIGLLTRRNLDLTTLEMAGVAYGSPGRSIPRHYIVGAASSIVARARSRAGMEPEYYDRTGRRLTLDEVVDDAVSSDGLVYASGKRTYKIRSGAVVGFAIYGPDLSAFEILSSYEEFLTLFGTPDRVETDDEPGGPPMRYRNYYLASRKCVVWDAWDNRVSLVNLGAFDA
jgi:hypothetical protein